jgi:signal transduction histidine kinase/CheY-like chemotaxis protein/HPt (histidine-containing phosphotransfer) domain-containing protein
VNDVSPLSWEQLNQLFTIVICIDAQEQVVFASPTCRRNIPALSEQASFFELFTLVRPAGPKSIVDMRRHLNSLFLLKTKDESFAIRGQMLEVHWQGQDVLCFCGAPWVFWMNANRPDSKLGMEDFSPQDSQLDQLFLMSTEQRMVSDLEELNTELQRAKKEIEIAQEGKNAMFARMSHEMRTPLNGVVSALALLGDQKLPAQAQQLLMLANSSARNLLHVINYVLDVSKLEAGKDALELESFELSLLLQAVSDIVRARAVEKRLKLTWRKSRELSPVYRADRAKLRQCLLNFVTNAVKFTNTGAITIRALPSPSGKENRVRFEVEDTGPGIKEADKRRIFEPFWTGSADAPDNERGTGLGLDLVRRYVDVMGGTLGVISQPGRGSLFWFEIPMEPREESVPLPTNESAPVSHAKRFQGRVLLVDDNVTNLLLGRLILESLGVTVVEASNWSVAVEKVNRENFDLVLMDVNMPVMDGVRATQAIRQRMNKEELPIVALSAYTSGEEKERCLAAGMNDFLTKPIVREQLALQLSYWLRAESDDTAENRDRSSHLRAAGEMEQTPSLALEVLSDLGEQIGETHLGKVLDQFVLEVRSRWENLSAAFVDSDAVAMKREAHTLASTCKSLGLIAAGTAFSALEDELQTQNPAPERIKTLEEHLNRGLAELAQYRADTTQ